MAGVVGDVFVKTFVYGLSALGFFVMMGVFWLLGITRGARVGGWLARHVGPLTSWHGIAKKNLSRAFPKLSAEEQKKILNQMWNNLGQTVGEYPHLGRFTKEPWRIEMKSGGTLPLEAFRAVADKGMLAFSGHCANWEVLPLVLPRLGWETVEIYRHINNPFINKWILWLRRKHIVSTQIPKKQALRPLLRSLKQGRAVALLLDQKETRGINVRFFGHPAMTSTVGALCVQRTGCLVMPAWGERLGPGRFCIRLYDFLELTSDVRGFTEKINAFLEARIREKPEQWLWIHNRWPR